MAFSASGITRSGPKRPRNEDAFLLFEHHGTLFMGVADGFGVGGETLVSEFASALALREIREFLSRYVTPGMTMGAIQYLMEQALYLAHRTVLAYRTANEGLYGGFGASVTLALLRETYEYALLHAGSTRFGKITESELTWLTVDHTEAERLIQSGRATPEERYALPEQWQVTRALGMPGDFRPDRLTGRLRPDDIVILTTDGVHGVLTDRTLVRILFEAGDSEKGVNAWSRTLEELNVPDNYAAVVSLCRF